MSAPLNKPPSSIIYGGPMALGILSVKISGGGDQVQSSAIGIREKLDARREATNRFRAIISEAFEMKRCLAEGEERKLDALVKEIRAIDAAVARAVADKMAGH